MPDEEEIIRVMRLSRANEPDKFKEYMDFYKKNHPDFYKEKLAPIFENGEPAKPVKKKPVQINPAEQLTSDNQPLGSANVGEELSIEEDTKKPAVAKTVSFGKPNEQQAPTIQRKKSPVKLILIIIGAIIGISLIGAAVYFLVLS
ncbi:MAG: hypothetical protein JW791_00215 [Nanoarchaeota archaeon]|nr:hypothetical protein [Nanoarchaeota archaeon]